MRRRIAALLLLTAAPLPAAAQLVETSRLPVARLAAPDPAPRLQQERELQAQRPRPALWAVPVTERLPQMADDQWQTLDGTAVWRLPIAVAGARSLGLSLRGLRLPDGAELTVSALDGSQLRGPYRAADVRSGRLQLPIVRGEQALLTLRVPAALRTQASLQIARVDYGFRSFQEALADSKAAGCNVDVACSAGDDWRDEARAVARYTVAHPDGAYFCTGTLVNNTAQDGRPYFLTADHCFRDNEGEFAGDPASVVLYWNFENPVCGGSAGGDDSMTQTGARLRANSGASDFVLLELDQPPPAAYDVFYAGWDRRDIAPVGATGIHHPQGDEKSISVEYDATTITDYSSNSPTDGADFLRIADWDVGVTESGSSGSALFNWQHYIVGTLTGGLAACKRLGSGDNNLPDWYGRFYSHWTGGGSAGTRLSNWLDPKGSGATTLAGTDEPGGDGGDNGGALAGPGLLLLALAAAARRRRPVCG